MLDNFALLSTGEALTFDDILIMPGYSEVEPGLISTQARLCEGLHLTAPLISAAMDTVTEHLMATALAKGGGFGVIHKNMSVKSQSQQVRKVKKFESGMIKDPITLEPEVPVYKALDVMRKHSISGVPIIKKEFLKGILTLRDLRFEKNLDQPLSRIMTPLKKLITAPEDTTSEEAKVILHRHRIEKLPVVDKKGNLKGMITLKDIKKAEAFPQATKDTQGRLFVGAAVGVSEEERERALALHDADVDLICVDSAHGYSKNVLNQVKWLKKKTMKLIMAGNVATPEGSLALAKAGADIVKVGMGPGSICTTRVVTGVGVPQVSALLNCVKALKEQKKGVVADGGIKFSGDFAKAMALGAGAVMVGNLFAGSDESPGEMTLYQGRAYKTYRGMGSLGAMKKGSKDRYRQGNVLQTEKMVPEGVEGRIPYRGSATAIIYQMLGGLKAAMGYAGVKNIPEFVEKARFIKVSSNAHSESHVHDVQITKEAPNYRLE